MSKHLEINLNTQPLERALKELIASTDKSMAEVVTETGKRVVTGWVTDTPKVTGRARAGFYPAWTGLGLRGRARAGKEAIMKYNDGWFKDARQTKDNPNVGIGNFCPYLRYITPKKTGINVQKAYNRRLRNATRYIEELTKTNMRKLTKGI